VFLSLECHNVSCVGFVFCVDLAGASALKLDCILRPKEDRRMKKARRMQIAYGMQIAHRMSNRTPRLKKARRIHCCTIASCGQFLNPAGNFSDMKDNPCLKDMSQRLAVKHC
jgi:hypothetical protein